MTLVFKMCVCAVFLPILLVGTVNFCETKQIEFFLRLFTVTALPISLHSFRSLVVAPDVPYTNSSIDRTHDVREESKKNVSLRLSHAHCSIVRRIFVEAKSDYLRQVFRKVRSTRFLG